MDHTQFTTLVGNMFLANPVVGTLTLSGLGMIRTE